MWQSLHVRNEHAKLYAQLLSYESSSLPAFCSRLVHEVGLFALEGLYIFWRLAFHFAWSWCSHPWT